jgi:hypothetical protein
MKKERIVKPNNLHPKGHKSSPEKKIDKFKLNLETVKEEEVVGRINTKKITDKKKKARLPPLITICRDLKTITTQFATYKILHKRIQYTAWQRGNLYKYQLNQNEQTSSSKYRYYRPKEYGFTLNEKVELRQALKYCVMHSNLAFDSSVLRFKDDLEQLKLWFGTDEISTIMRVIEGIYKINKILIDPEQMITFIDMRHQRARNGMTSSILEPAPGLSTCYGKTCTEFVTEKYGPDPDTPKGLGVPKHLPANGMSILVGEHMMQPFQSPQDRALIIYHELTHKILGTMDKGFGKLPNSPRGIEPIFGSIDAQHMAKRHPERTFMIADCWAYFVASFGNFER